VVSPGAAISNAVANAIGVRVPFLPLTPARVLEALEQGGANASV
jgi:CO/xanthine dehydrogenase Mo-binding subunit